METDLLAELINSKYDVLDQLHQLSRRQSELVGQGDLTRLLELLAAKQILLGQLQQLERQLDPFRDQDPDGREWRSPADRQRCQQTAACCAALLQEIMVLEKQGEAALLHRRDQVAAQLQGAHSASQASQAYTQPSWAQPSQLDLTSDR